MFTKRIYAYVKHHHLFNTKIKLTLTISLGPGQGGSSLLEIAPCIVLSDDLKYKTKHTCTCHGDSYLKLSCYGIAINVDS